MPKTDKKSQKIFPVVILSHRTEYLRAFKAVTRARQYQVKPLGHWNLRHREKVYSIVFTKDAQKCLLRSGIKYRSKHIENENAFDAIANTSNGVKTRIWSCDLHTPVSSLITRLVKHPRLSPYNEILHVLSKIPTNGYTRKDVYPLGGLLTNSCETLGL